MSLEKQHASARRVQARSTVSALPSSMALDLSALGQLVRERRLAAGLNQATLAKLTGLSEVTIRNVEHAHNPPSEDTLRRLLEVAQLDLSVADLPTQHHNDLENDLEFFRKLSWFIAPDYEVLKLWLDFRKQLNSEAGHIEQTYLYLDAESAADYMRMSNSYEYEGEIREKLPYASISKVLVQNIPQNHLDVVALGPGDAQLETRLVQSLITQRTDLRLKFYLLDISQPLLNVAYRHAADSLSDYSNVFIAGMQGNFYDLPSYQHIFYIPKGRPTCRLFLMLGGTMNNIDNEIRFFRHSLGIAAVGDLLLMNVQLTFGSELTESAIRQADSSFNKPVPSLHAKWLGGPIRRYCDNVADISFRTEMRLDCVIPGSYASDVVAKVAFQDGRVRHISMCRFKRYDTKRFAECLRDENWELVEDWPCGESAVKSTAFLLFRKVSPSIPEMSEEEAADAASERGPAGFRR